MGERFSKIREFTTHMIPECSDDHQTGPYFTNLVTHD